MLLVLTVTTEQH